jgi:hypothetical protein
LGLVVGIAVAWAIVASASSTLASVTRRASSTAALCARFAWDLCGIPMRYGCFACRSRDLFKPRGISNQVFNNMAAFHHICLDDLSLQAVNQFSKVEVYLAVTILKGSYVHAVFEILQEVTEGLHGLTVLLPTVEIRNRQLRSSNSRILDDVLQQVLYHLPGELNSLLVGFIARFDKGVNERVKGLT